MVEKCLNEKLYHNYSFKIIKKKLQENNFIFLKKFKDPIWNYEDHVYKNQVFFEKNFTLLKFFSFIFLKNFENDKTKTV